jgi:hypothetical protein
LDYTQAQSLLEALVGAERLPSLALKTLLLVCETYPAFKNLAISSLGKLAQRDTTSWDDAVLCTVVDNCYSSCYLTCLRRERILYCVCSTATVVIRLVGRTTNDSGTS